jgi:molybdopterin/thiamine biosynthesis adenylyltransferase
VSDAAPPYEELFTRNIGFVDENEQMLLRTARVAVCGVGGMGGVVAQVLARSGVGGLTVLDKDRFEPSNNNRQVYAHAGSWGRTKVEVTTEELARVNPALEVRAFDHFGADNVAAVLEGVDVAVNGMDELPACLRLWRAARERNIPVVDAWSAPLPNVFVLRPEDPPPEEFLEYPTRGLAPEELTPEIVDECKLREALHVSLHTRSLRYLDFEIVKEIMTGKRARISFAPMVWGAGLMMAWEALKLRLGRGRVASRFGRFWDPWRGDARDARGFNGVELAIIKRAHALKARFGA